MRARRGFWLNDPWYTDWVLLTAAVLGVIVGVSQVAHYYSGAGVISPLAIVDFLFAFVVATAEWGLVLLLIRWIVRKAAHTPGGATQPGRTPAKSAVRVRVAAAKGDPVTEGALRYCSDCGSSVAPEARFCSTCGQSFSSQVLTAPPAEMKVQSPRSPVRSLRILGGIALLAIVLVIGDWWMRNQEMNALVTQIEASETVLEAHNAQMKSAESLFPWNAKYHGETAATERLASVITSTCATSAAHAMATGDEVKRVSILPWHTAIKDAQDAYMRHSHAWEDHLNRCSQDPTVGLEPAPGASGSLGPSLRGAVPPAARYDLGSRVDAIMLN